MPSAARSSVLITLLLAGVSGCGDDCQSDPSLPPTGVALTAMLISEAERISEERPSVDVTTPTDHADYWIFVPPLAISGDLTSVRHLLSPSHVEFVHDVSNFEIERVAIYAVEGKCISAFGFIETRFRLRGEAFAVSAGDAVRLVRAGEWPLTMEPAN